MMNLRKGLLAAVALCVLAGMASADPMRTVFTKENKFPGALKPELSLFGGASSFDADEADGDVDRYFVGTLLSGKRMRRLRCGLRLALVLLLAAPGHAQAPTSALMRSISSASRGGLTK